MKTKEELLAELNSIISRMEAVEAACYPLRGYADGAAAVATAAINHVVDLVMAADGFWLTETCRDKNAAMAGGARQLVVNLARQAERDYVNSVGFQRGPDTSPAIQCSEACEHPFYCAAFATTPQEPKTGLSKEEIEQKLYAAGEHTGKTLAECFPTTPEGVAAMEAQFAHEGPVKLPESLQDATAVLTKIIEGEKRRCPMRGKPGEVMNSNLDWCPACRYQWPGN